MAPATLTLRVFDSSGLQVAVVAGGNAAALPGSLSVSQEPWDPAAGPLVVSGGGWSMNFDGRDSSGAVLRNGAYLLVVSDAGGSSVQKALQILGAGQGRVSLSVGPNPIRPGQTFVSIKWSPITQLELKIYGLDGGLIRDLGVTGPPVAWDLRTGQGQVAANGIYFVCARLAGERQPQTFKLMVAR